MDPRKRLLNVFAERKHEITHRLVEFKAVPESEYFYEMAFCLLTPQTSARAADQSIRMLKNLDYQNTDIDAEPVLRSGGMYIRFHRTKAKRLKELKTSYREAFTVLTSSGFTAVERRAELIRIVKGYGYKEASHLLRNIGKNEGLAILDRHILRNLNRLGIIESVPNSLSPAAYLKVENLFVSFAESLSILPDELDLLFWSMETGTVLK